MTNVQKITDSFYLTFFLVERIPKYVMFHVWSSGLEWVALPLRRVVTDSLLSPAGRCVASSLAQFISFPKFYNSTF